MQSTFLGPSYGGCSTVVDTFFESISRLISCGLVQKKWAKDLDNLLLMSGAANDGRTWCGKGPTFCSEGCPLKRYRGGWSSLPVLGTPPTSPGLCPKTPMKGQPKDSTVSCPLAGNRLGWSEWPNKVARLIIVWSAFPIRIGIFHIGGGRLSLFYARCQYLICSFIKSRKALRTNITQLVDLIL